MTRVFKLILGCVAGLVIGVVGAFVHANRTVVGNLHFTYGFLLALALLALTQLWLGRALQSRLAPIGIALSWAGVTLVLGGLVGNEATVISAQWYSKVYVFGGAIICGMISAFPILKPVPPSNSLEEPFTNVMERQPPN